MIDPSGNFVGQVCHIEAANKGGERFNEKMSNEDRRSFDNLMLLCYPHHIETNDIVKYDVPSLKMMKEKHEKIFSDDLIANKILLSLKDYTKESSFQKVSNLKNLYKTVFAESYKTAEDELNDAVNAFNSSIAKYLSLTPYSRKVFACGIARSNHPYKLYRIDNDSLYVDVAEVCRAFGRETNDRDIHNSFNEIIAKNLMLISEVNINENYEVDRLVYTNCLDHNEYDLNIWLLLKNYCEKSQIDIRNYLNDLNFSGLDD
ncbi:hypothetical protein CSY59_18195 [Salmonella enterica]|nr:hypothetical protein [Salmonella enterica]